MARKQQGYVYFLLFDTPLGNPANRRGTAQTYCGFATDVDARLAEHRAGRGAAVERGIGFKVVLVIEGDRTKERQIKNTKNTRRWLQRHYPHVFASA